MKSLLLAIIAIIGALSFCFAQDTAGSAAPKPSPITASDTRTFTGKVESVVMADPVKGTKPQIVLTDEAGKKNIFFVKATATIYDSRNKPVTFDKIKTADTLKVKYSTDQEGVVEATLIHIE